MKRFFVILLAIALCLPFACALSDEEEAGAVFAGTPEPVETEAEEGPRAREPYVPDDAEKRIVYSDDRIDVDVRSYPYRAIAYIETHATCGCTATGSGFLVGPSGLVTAGHVLCCTKHDAKVDRLTMYFGYKSAKNYAYKYTKGTTYWYNYSKKPGSEEYDFGYVKLQERVGDKMGWFGVSVMNDAQSDAGIFYAAGYRHGVLKQDMDFAYVVTPYQLRHLIDTEPGYSGCPLFNGEYYAIAINVAESRNLQENYACRITNWLFEEMESDGIFD